MNNDDYKAVSYTHLGDLSFVIESLTALRRKPFYHRKRVFQIDDKLDLDVYKRQAVASTSSQERTGDFEVMI